MELTPVDPQSLTPGRTGASYKLLKEFMESGELVSAVKQSNQTLMSLRAIMTYYVKTRDLPIRVFQHDNEIHIARLDKRMDEDGNIVDVPNWREDGKEAQTA